MGFTSCQFARKCCISWNKSLKQKYYIQFVQHVEQKHHISYSLSLYGLRQVIYQRQSNDIGHVRHMPNVLETSRCIQCTYSNCCYFDGLKSIHSVKIANICWLIRWKIVFGLLKQTVVVANVKWFTDDLRNFKRKTTYEPRICNIFIP